MKLYEIPIEANEIEATLADSAGELTPEVERRISDFLREGKDKIEAAAIVTNSLLDDAKLCKAEAERLLKRAAGLANAADRLKGLILFAVDEGFGGKVKTAKFTIWAQNSGDTVSFDCLDIYQVAAVAPWAIRTSNPELDKKALKEARDAGLELPEAITVSEQPGTRYLRIK